MDTLNFWKSQFGHPVMKILAKSLPEVTGHSQPQIPFFSLTITLIVTSFPVLCDVRYLTRSDWSLPATNLILFSDYKLCMVPGSVFLELEVPVVTSFTGAM